MGMRESGLSVRRGSAIDLTEVWGCSRYPAPPGTVTLPVYYGNSRYMSSFVFFFQAEDGIRDLTVTGVQTCALPIFSSASRRFSFSSARLCVMFTPREMAATPSTRKVNATTLPMPMSALTKVCDTSTARDDPEPCGTTMTVQRCSAFLRIRSPRPRIKTGSPGTAKAPVHQDLPKGEPGQGVGSGSQVWTSKVRLDWKGVNTSERDANHTRSGTYAGASRGLGNRMGGFWNCRPPRSKASRSPSRTRSSGPDR